MTFRVDRRVYSDACISKSVYALADKYTILRSVEDEHELLDVHPVNAGVSNERVIKADLFNTLNDFNLRCIIEEETKDIRTIIYAKAFADYNENC